MTQTINKDEAPLPLNGAAARQAQINAKISDDLKRLAEEGIQAGGDVNLPSAAHVTDDLPKDLAGALTLLQQRSVEFDLVPDDRQHRRKWLEARAALDRIRDHVRSIQQGNTAPVVDLNSVRQAECNKLTNAELNRQNRIRDLEFALSCLRHPGRFIRESHVKGDLRKLAVKDLLLTFEGIPQLLAEATRTAINLEIATLKSWNIAKVSERIAELKVAMLEQEADIPTIQNELARLRSPEAETIAIMEKRKLGTLKDCYEQSVASLRDGCVTALRKVLSDAIRSESEFFAAFALTRTATPVSGRYKQAIHDLETMRVSKDSLQWWGLKNIGHYVAWCHLDKHPELEGR